MNRDLCLKASGAADSSRLAGFVLLGAFRALELGLVRAADIESRLFIPLVTDRLRECGVAPGIVEVAEGSGIELATLEDIDRAELLKAVDDLQAELLEALRALQNEPIDPNLYWIPE